MLVAARFDGAGELEQAIAKGAFAMVNVGDDAEVAEAVNWDGGDALLEVGLGSIGHGVAGGGGAKLAQPCRRLRGQELGRTASERALQWPPQALSGSEAWSHECQMNGGISEAAVVMMRALENCGERRRSARSPRNPPATHQPEQQAQSIGARSTSWVLKLLLPAAIYPKIFSCRVSFGFPAQWLPRQLAYTVLAAALTRSPSPTTSLEHTTHHSVPSPAPSHRANQDKRISKNALRKDPLPTESTAPDLSQSVKAFSPAAPSPRHRPRAIMSAEEEKPKTKSSTKSASKSTSKTATGEKKKVKKSSSSKDDAGAKTHKLALKGSSKVISEFVRSAAVMPDTLR